MRRWPFGVRRVDWRKLEMPLLLRELRQQAAARRTYVVRFCYALALFAISCWLFYGGTAETGVGSLGRGRWMFRSLVMIQFWAAIVLIPVITCGVITTEKERNSLGVLLLTPLGSFRIILQKLLSRLIPVFSFVLLSLPLMAVAFSHGGVTDGQLKFGILMLFLTSAQIGALSILCSSWARTTPIALGLTFACFIASYLLFPPFWLNYYLESAGDGRLLGGLVVALMTVAVTLAMATTILVNRAFLTPKNLLLDFFEALDKFFNEANQAIGGIELVKDKRSAPKDRPVAWRETSRRSLGTFRYQFRVLVALELPVILLVVLQDWNFLRQNLQATILILWGITVMLIAVQSASLIAAERSRQTLDVLLTTPISGRSILLQKCSGVWRLLLVLTVPFVTVAGVLAWIVPELRNEYLVWSVVSVLASLTAVAWFGIWMSTRHRNQLRSVVQTVLILGAVLGGGYSMLRLLAGRLDYSAATINRIGALSPVDVVCSLHQPSLGSMRSPSNTVYAVHFGLAVCMALLFRALALRGIDGRLGRVPEGYRMDSRRIPPEARGEVAAAEVTPTDAAPAG